MCVACLVPYCNANINQVNCYCTTPNIHCHVQVNDNCPKYCVRLFSTHTAHYVKRNLCKCNSYVDVFVCLCYCVQYFMSGNIPMFGAGTWCCVDNCRWCTRWNQRAVRGCGAWMTISLFPSFGDPHSYRWIQTLLPICSVRKRLSTNMQTNTCFLDASSLFYQ